MFHTIKTLHDSVSEYLVCYACVAAEREHDIVDEVVAEGYSLPSVVYAFQNTSDSHIEFGNSPKEHVLYYAFYHDYDVREAYAISIRDRYANSDNYTAYEYVVTRINLTTGAFTQNGVGYPAPMQQGYPRKTSSVDFEENYAVISADLSCA